MQSDAGRRRALIFGASSTIGLVVCDRYLAAGYEVLAHYGSHGEQLELKAAQQPLMSCVKVDLSDLSAVADFTNALAPLDVLVFLAAHATPSHLENLNPELVEHSLRVGCLSNYVVMGQMGPIMADRGWGRIVIGSSIGVKFGGGVDSFAYALANHASEFIPRSARDWATQGVLTNVVRIGVTDTSVHASFPGRSMEKRAQLIPIGRPASPSEIADFIYWHGSEENTYVTGQVTAISGGE